MGRSLRLGHLADLHLASNADLARFDSQLAHLVSTSVEHLAITGDLLDAWDPGLLRLALRSLERAGYRSPDRLTLIHGNHDVSSAGSPTTKAGALAAQIGRAFDLPFVLARRQHRFYREIARLHPGHQVPPFLKILPDGTELAAIDSVSRPIAPIRIDARRVQTTHAGGRVSKATLGWLDALPPPRPGVSRGLVLHHYPLDTPPLQRFGGLVEVPMAIEPRSRRRLWHAIQRAGFSFILCGHVHRARRERMHGVHVWLQGTSGGAWAGYASSVYEVPRECSEFNEDAGAQIDGRAAPAL
jgi:3',5'-cyclic AMP phosphodiesterase CpdA